MNRTVLTGTIHSAWRPLAGAVQQWGSIVLESALKAAAEQERDHRRVFGGRYRVGCELSARLFVLNHAYLVCSVSVPLPSTWTALAAEPRARSLAYAMGEQIKARHLQAAAFPYLDFASINYVEHIVIHARKDSEHA